MTKYELDKEEQELLSLFKQGKLKQSKTMASDRKAAKDAAILHMRKNARINIRLSQFDLDKIKRIAAKEGLPYQTLISSVLHKYADKNL
ncbi:MAG: hypothetical protein K0R73_665 [Candidatus Midichloriaceae bacterium]|jgi:predicted DNA binding CopG/RHH family protein|nr:hypothetical protein [Candidatus Midichloriaceae bacterium]